MIEMYFLLWYVQEVAELKEEDILGVSLPTTGACGHSSILSESQYTHTHTYNTVTVVLPQQVLMTWTK